MNFKLNNYPLSDFPETYILGGGIYCIDSDNTIFNRNFTSIRIEESCFASFRLAITLL